MSETNGVCTGFINDGQTRNALIKAVPGLHPELKFTFRPMLAWESEEMFDRRAQVSNNPQGREFILAKGIMSKVKSWSFDQDPTPDAFMRLVLALRTRLMRIVLGELPDDSGPASEDTKEDWRKEMEAFTKGESVQLIESGN